MSSEAIKELIAQRMADALATYKTNQNTKNGNGNGSGSQFDDRSGSRRTVHMARGCAYKEFLNCQPLNFKVKWILKKPQTKLVNSADEVAKDMNVSAIDGNDRIMDNTSVNNDRPMWRMILMSLVVYKCLINQIMELHSEEVVEGAAVSIMYPAVEEENIEIEYEWRPPRCETCKIFDHTNTRCPKRVDVIKPVGNNKPSTMPITNRDNEEGFVEVKTRKKKGKKDDGSQAFGGIRLSKPKTNVIWNQKKIKGSKGGSNAASSSGTTMGGEKMPSLSCAKPNLNIPVSNPFDLLNTIEEDANDHNPTVSEPIDRGSSKMDDVKVQEDDSLWKRFQISKKVSSQEDDTDEESEVEEYPPYDTTCISSIVSGFYLEDDDLDCYDGYEAKGTPLPKKRNEIQKLETKLWNLTVKGTDIAGYTQRFQELAFFCLRMVPEEEDKVESYAVTGSIPINRGLIQAIPTSLPPQPIGEATKASNLQRIPPGVQRRSHFIYFLYLIIQIRILSWDDLGFTILYYPRSGSLPVSALSDMEDDVDISALTMEQYIALIPDVIKPGIVNPKIGDDVKFKINANFMRELRCKLFAGTDDEDAYEHVRTVLEIVDLFHFPGVTRNAIILGYFQLHSRDEP
nr:hypothetical protein [Tanacetum cinerariifolium]